MEEWRETWVRVEGWRGSVYVALLSTDNILNVNVQRKRTTDE